MANLYDSVFTFEEKKATECRFPKMQKTSISSSLGRININFYNPVNLFFTFRLSKKSFDILQKSIF